MIFYLFFCIHVLFCNIKIKIKKGEDFEKFRNIVKEYIKDENNQTNVLKYWETYIDLAQDKQREDIKVLIKKHAVIDDGDAIIFASTLARSFRMLFICCV